MTPPVAASPSGPTAVGGGYAELLVGTLLVLGVICVVAYVIVRTWGRRFQGGSGGGVIHVVARVSLEPRRSLYVIEIAGRTFVVGSSELGLNVLAEVEPGAVQGRAPDATRPAGGFAEAIRAALGRRAAVEPAAAAVTGAASPASRLGVRPGGFEGGAASAQADPLPPRRSAAGVADGGADGGADGSMGGGADGGADGGAGGGADGGAAGGAGGGQTGGGARPAVGAEPGGARVATGGAAEGAEGGSAGGDGARARGGEAAAHGGPAGAGAPVGLEAGHG